MHSLCPNPFGEATSNTVGLDHVHKCFFLPFYFSYCVSSTSPCNPVSLPQHGFLHRPQSLRGVPALGHSPKRVFPFDMEHLLQQPYFQLRVRLAACLSMYLHVSSQEHLPACLQIYFLYIFPPLGAVILSSMCLSLGSVPSPVCLQSLGMLEHPHGFQSWL